MKQVLRTDQSNQTPRSPRKRYVVLSIKNGLEHTRPGLGPPWFVDHKGSIWIHFLGVKKAWCYYNQKLSPHFKALPSAPPLPPSGSGFPVDQCYIVRTFLITMGGWEKHSFWKVALQCGEVVDGSLTNHVPGDIISCKYSHPSLLPSRHEVARAL